MPARPIHTLEQFMEILYEKQPKFKDIYLEPISEYLGTNKYMLFQDKYGIIKTLPTNLLGGYVPTIKSAIDKNSYFDNQFKSINPKIFNQLERISDFIGSKIKLLFNSKHGVVSLTPYDAFICKTISIVSAVNQKEFWSNRSKEKHGDIYDYSLVDYSQTNVKIICKTCSNIFLQHKVTHSSCGSGCPKCGKISKAKNRSVPQEEFLRRVKEVYPENTFEYYLDTYKNNREPVKIRCIKHDVIFHQIPYNHINGIQSCEKCVGVVHNLETFLEKAFKVHNNFYSYDKMTEYLTLVTKYIITCPLHGDFKQSGAGHLAGKGCNTCALIQAKVTYERQDMKDADKIPYKVYVLEISSDNEHFYKVGIAKKPKSRVTDIINKTGYNISILNVIDTNLREAVELEQSTLKNLKAYKHIPKIYFAGYTECLSINPIEYINFTT